MTELQAAVAGVQLKKLASVIERRRNFANTLNKLLRQIDGVKTPHVAEGIEHSYWFYPFTIDTKRLGVDAETFVKEVTAEGIPVTFPYIGMPVYLFDTIKNMRIYGKTTCPFDCPFYGKKVSYTKGLCPNAEKALTEMMVLPCNEFMTESDARDIASALKKVCDYHLNSM
jgi:dTDP-4-amino-4,6-dideoxygalactose transaminase